MGNSKLSIVLLCFFVIITIKTKDMLCFYMFFEISLLPIAIIIFVYGYQPEKINAIYSLVLYTIISRFPLFLHIVYGFRNNDTATIPMTLCFMVKTPIYLLHIWLPKAHVEAPIGGSILLAGVMLKLGTYGLILFLPEIKLNYILSFYLSMAIIGSIVSSLICLRQRDIKSLIAYSSVVHMGFVTIGLMSGSELGYSRAIIMVIAHGISSPILFAIAH